MAQKETSRDTRKDRRRDTRRLYKNPDDSMIAGVAAGLADYFDIDVTLMRVIFVLLAVITGGVFILGYIVLAIIMPSTEEQVRTKKAEVVEDGSDTNLNFGNILGIGLVLLGAWLLIGQFFPGWFDIRWSVIWPALLILLGVLLVTKSGR